MWDEILKNKPDLWVWMGDNIYGDSEDPYVLIKKYNRLLRSKSYQNFLVNCPVIGTWDDHDYGKNDGGKDYPSKEISKKLLLDFLNVEKSNPVYEHEGVYQKYDFNSGDHMVRIVLLDTRYFRDILEPDPKGEERYAQNLSGTILGEEQWNWLGEQLNDSPADVHIIVSSIQVLAEEHIFEKWSNFPEEKKRFLKLINDSKAKNPIILSGDRHMAELSMIKLKNGIELVDVTSSGLTHCWPMLFPEENNYRQRGVIADLNFGLLKFDWEQSVLKVELRGIDNKLHFDYDILLNQH
jgi:alkaline phosphatase D